MAQLRKKKGDQPAFATCGWNANARVCRCKPCTSSLRQRTETVVKMQSLLQANGCQDLVAWRQTPRDLPGRPAPRRPSQTEDRPAAPDQGVCKRSI